MSDTITIADGQKVRIGGTTYLAEGDGAFPGSLTALPKQTTRMYKVWCPTCTVASGKPYQGRMARATMDEGMPFCGKCLEPMISDYTPAKNQE